MFIIKIDENITIRLGDVSRKTAYKRYKVEKSRTSKAIKLVEVNKDGTLDILATRSGASEGHLPTVLQIFIR